MRSTSDENNPETCLGAAAAYADMGCVVLPLRGKIPFTARGHLDATRDYLLIDSWFARWPAAGVGIATGAPSGVWVLDVDGDAGAASLAALPSLPVTVEAITRRGRHFYFRMPADGEIRNSASTLAPGLDTRGTGGYIVAPPSPHPDGGHYEWRRSPFAHDLAETPDWLIDLVGRDKTTTDGRRDLPRSPRPPKYVRAAIADECARLARTSKGARNDQLNASAFRLARFVAEGSVDAADVAGHLADAAMRAGLPYAETRRTVLSGLRSGTRTT